MSIKEAKVSGSEEKESVLILSPFFRPNIGGVETHLDDLCEYLRKNGHKVFVITYQPLTTKAKGKKLEKKENLEIHRMQWFGYNLFPKLELYPVIEFLYLFPGLFICSFFFFLLKHRKKIDVIHAQGLNAALITKIAARIFRKRVVCSIHAIYNLKRKSIFAKVIKLTLASFDRILTLSFASREELVRIGLDAQKLSIYTHWVNQEVFRPMDKDRCRRELGWQDKFIVLFVGRFIEKKGVRLLIEIAKEFETRFHNIHFVLIGDGPLAEEARKAAEQSRNLTFIGQVHNENLPRYYNAADMVIMPSLYEEPFGRVIIEALSCCVPIIASNRGGIPEAVDSSVAILIEPKVEEFIESIMHLYEHPSKIEALRKNCSQYARKRFSEENAKIIENSYK